MYRQNSAAVPRPISEEYDEAPCVHEQVEAIEALLVYPPPAVHASRSKCRQFLWLTRHTIPPTEVNMTRRKASGLIQGGPSELRCP